MLKDYKHLPWPTNLWSTILKEKISPSKLPKDWERVLEYALNSISPPRRREVILYFFRDGKTLREIGAIYDNTTEAIRQHAEKAIRAFRHPTKKVFFQLGMEAGRNALLEAQKPNVPSMADLEAIDGLNLSARAWNCLKRNDIHTIGQLSKHTEKELLSMHGMGMTTVKEIGASLAEHSLTLRAEGG